MKINILIEQLILDGLPIEQRDDATVQKAIELEFAHLLEQNGFGPIDAVNDGSPNQSGHKIAESAHDNSNKV